MDLITPPRGSDIFTITRKGVDGSADEYKVSLDDLLKFMSYKTRAISKEDIAGVLARTLREKASIRHRHSAEDIQGIAEAIADAHCCAHGGEGEDTVHPEFVFTKTDW